MHGHKTTSIPHSYLQLEKPTKGWGPRHPQGPCPHGGGWRRGIEHSNPGGRGFLENTPPGFGAYSPSPPLNVGDVTDVLVVGCTSHRASPGLPRRPRPPRWSLGTERMLRILRAPWGGGYFLVPGYGITIYSLSTYSCHVEGENEGCIYSFRRTLSSRVLSDCKFELKNKVFEAIPGQIMI